MSDVLDITVEDLGIRSKLKHFTQQFNEMVETANDSWLDYWTQIYFANNSSWNRLVAVSLISSRHNDLDTITNEQFNKARNWISRTFTAAEINRIEELCISKCHAVVDKLEWLEDNLDGLYEGSRRAGPFTADIDDPYYKGFIEACTIRDEIDSITYCLQYRNELAETLKRTDQIGLEFMSGLPFEMSYWTDRLHRPSKIWEAHGTVEKNWWADSEQWYEMEEEGEI